MFKLENQYEKLVCNYAENAIALTRTPIQSENSHLLMVRLLIKHQACAIIVLSKWRLQYQKHKT